MALERMRTFWAQIPILGWERHLFPHPQIAHLPLWWSWFATFLRTFVGALHHKHWQIFQFGSCHRVGPPLEKSMA